MKTSAFFRIALLTAGLVVGSASIATDAFARGHGIGHNLPQEAPQAFAEAIVDVAEI